MYIPEHFRMDSTSEIHTFIERFEFGLMVSSSLNATHVPFLLARDEGEHGALYGHMAKPNPHWREFPDEDLLVVFAGPHGYVSPTWYASKPAVPTWNYAAVHVRGAVSLLDADQTLATINETLMHHEPSLLEDNDVLTDSHKQKLLTGIVGFRLEIIHLEGKAKLSQNRSTADRQGVIRQLDLAKDASSRELAQLMKELG